MQKNHKAKLPMTNELFTTCFHETRIPKFHKSPKILFVIGGYWWKNRIQNSLFVKICGTWTIFFLKVRLDRNITNNGRNELEVYNRAQMAASSTNLPLMVHHTNSTIDLGQKLLACGRAYFPTTVCRKAIVTEILTL